MSDAGVLATGKALWHRLRARIATYLANADPIAEASNTGAFLVWSNQPFYPIYVWLLVGRDFWPALLTWFSTPVFFAVPLVARTSSIAGRALFVVAGVANTLLSAKAFGTATEVGWFLVPCFVLAAGFFRLREWKIGAAMSALTAAAGVAVPYLGHPLHAYTPDEARALAHLNLWSVTVLSLYLVYGAIRARRASSGDLGHA